MLVLGRFVLLEDLGPRGTGREEGEHPGSRTCPMIRSLPSGNADTEAQGEYLTKDLPASLHI